MPTSTSEPAAAGLAIADALRRRARDLGFDAIGFARADAVPDVSERLQRFITLGRHGDMDWLAAKADRRRAPHALWPEVRSVIMLGMNYGPAGDPLTLLRRTDRGNISVYARGRDYHDVIKGRLKQLARWLGETHDAGVKVFVDTAPVAEKPLAMAAGLGWQGKHTNLVHREFGSWLFLGAIFTDLTLPADAAHDDHCGDCRRCLDVCPTQAFPAPYQLDARRCISYLTIEHKGHIAAEFRAAMGNRIFGCDDCLAVCPWNKFAQLARETTLMPRAELTAPRLADLMRLTDADFRAVFAGTPVKRLGRDRFVRNVLIAAGNSGEAALLPQVEALLGDASPLVRAMAVWALRCLADTPRIRRLRTQRLAEETDADVLQEWHAADVVAAAPV